MLVFNCNYRRLSLTLNVINWVSVIATDIYTIYKNDVQAGKYLHISNERVGSDIQMIGVHRTPIQFIFS